MRLNALFAVVVPIVNRRGGHVDKFVGDGLIAMFGAPEHFRDHADRAVRAACEMANVVNAEDEPGFKIGVGVNTGRVVAGAIGGAGRLNFSVIGEAVNIASRVEAATRDLDENVLITEATARELSDDIEVTECGEHELKGLPEPLGLFAPRMREAEGVQPGEEPLAGARVDGRPGGLAPTRGGLGDARRGSGGIAQL
jgi:adenylate cyclase